MTFQPTLNDIAINNQLIADAVASGEITFEAEVDDFATARNVNRTFRLLNKHNRPGYEDPQYVSAAVAGAMKTILMAVGNDVFTELSCRPADPLGNRPVAKVINAVVDRRINLVDIQAMQGVERLVNYNLNVAQVNTAAN